MVTVLYRFVAAGFSVFVCVLGVDSAPIAAHPSVIVDVPIMQSMELAIVLVIHMVVVLYGVVPALVSVHMAM
jgi:hypothetical protein